MPPVALGEVTRMSQSGRTFPAWPRRGVLDGVASVALIGASIAVVWKALSPEGGTPPVPPLPTTPVSLAQAATLGSPSAPVAILVFSDFQCPYCRTFALKVLPMLREKYVDRGLLRVVYRHFPIQAIHPLAFKAAEASECANRQGRFWPFVEFLFEQGPSTLNDSLLARGAAAIGVNADEFQDCTRSGAAQEVQRDIEEATRLGIRGTPTTLAGTVDSNGLLNVARRIPGSPPAADFEKAIRDLLESLRTQ